MIRKANYSDISKMYRVFEIAKTFMKATGNPNQWDQNYPKRELLENDIQNDSLHVIENNNEITGVFVFALGVDPTYSLIDGGQWLNDEEYGTIHRLASDGTQKGMFKKILTFCQKDMTNIRIDTHKDNTVMQSIVLQNGFKYCGIIYLANGDERLAYHLKVN